MKNKISVILFAFLVICLAFSGCGLEPIVSTEPDIQAVAPPSPSPKQELDEEEFIISSAPEKAVFVIDGLECSLDSFNICTESEDAARKKKNADIAGLEEKPIFVRLSDLASKLDSELIYDDETEEYFFRWGDGYVTFYPLSADFEVVDSMHSLEEPAVPFSTEPKKRDPVMDNMYVPVYSVMDALFPSQFYDYLEEKTYYMSVSDSWAPEAGYKVPVMQYYTVSKALGSQYATIQQYCVDPEDFEEQLKYLKLNGYQTVSFEDLESVAKLTKPIILTFDEGYKDNYSVLYPLLKKYNMKATMFICPAYVDTDGYLTTKQIKEMSLSGLVSVQPMGMNHSALDQISLDAQTSEITDPKEYIIKLTGKVPVAFCYSSGVTTDHAKQVVAENYIFGVKQAMQSCYVTGETVTDVPRFSIIRSTSLDSFTAFLSKS